MENCTCDNAFVGFLTEMGIFEFFAKEKNSSSSLNLHFLNRKKFLKIIIFYFSVRYGKLNSQRTAKPFMIVFTLTSATPQI